MSCPRYPAYKDSGVEWLGEVPEHWEMVPLGTISTSLQTGPFGSQLHSSEYVDNETPVINPSNIQNGRLVIDPSSTVGPEVLLRLERHRLLPGDIVVGRRGEMGRCAVVTDESSGWLCGTGSLRVRLQPSATSEFVGVHLRTDFVREWLSLQSVGSTMENLNTSILARVPVPYPPVLEQQAVVEFLDRETDKIDALVAEQEKMIELLKEKRQAVISHAVTKGLDPSVPMKDSGVEWLGEVPAHWAVVRLKRVAHVQTGVAKGKDNTGRKTLEVPYMRVANVQDGYLDLEDVATIDMPEDDLARYLLECGDVLMNEGGDFDKLGRGHIWDGSIEPCVHQNHVFAVRPFGVSSEWLNLFTGSFAAQFYFMSRSKQSTNLASISSSNLMELSVPLPSAAECDEIVRYVAEKVSAFEALASSAERSKSLLQERRSALISAAVTGQIDVRGLADRMTTPDSIAAHADSTPTQGRFDSESAEHAA